jgi:hemerythrin-like domain-containing protein
VARIDRRSWLKAATVGTAWASRGSAAAEAAKNEDIPPTEDLMREHGVLRRILIVYDEAARRLAADDAVALPVVAEAAKIVRRFVEGYHENLEEEFVLPKLDP